ncbi:HlyD family type I secretion periplasmic adaptor subunit [Lutimaribacter sp. EGI FJ00015]|uniref:HlyD family type I secretion periplasmic adaptor subunit n=1 Tax=Lutimaribacter degradans TaxID=2945989 RepID=A0ACC5ZU34_9RHOB|nr:HlyD family type I secretion periplasmic adaptor subunit [Lutimaribacter sp. EGI FJ00013]MCO0613131.1 HlyD family type I secretion periplasmic adaptor subunit [Lutimaribacter sp. EGI FJ00015]MCO0635669.1 HlyD family type I secretion periplasmic adaptor subunit [Lutimaribacter sp. EGI FJ00014]
MSTAKTRFSIAGSMTLGIITLVVLVGGFGGWAAFTNLSGAIIAGGQIEVDQNRQVVQHPDGGVVADILVDEGDTVVADQMLIRLDASRLRSDLAIVEGQLYEILARRARLEAERDGVDALQFDPLLSRAVAERAEVQDLMDGQRRLFSARAESIANEVDQLKKRRGQIANQVDGIAAQQKALDEQLTLIERELTDQQSLLDRGLAQVSRVLTLQRERARLSGQMGELAAQKAQAEGRMTEIDIEVIKLRNRHREDAISNLRDLQFRELELVEQRRALKERLDRLDIRAPVGGVVYGLQVFAPRSVVRAADPVLFVVPQDRPLVIAARVDPIHIDQISVGQQVTLRFSALDQRTTPELTGTVQLISADAFTDEGRGISYYRAEITLSEGEQAKLPEGVSLIPGMPVEAFIRTADRTPLAYLVKPLTDYFAKAFREG